jgi:hypothetical protein
VQIYLVDKQKYFNVTFDEVMNILASGLNPSEWTRENIQKYLLY